MLNMRNELRLDSRTVPEQSFPVLITKLSPRTQPKISILINSHLWFFKTVFILCENDGYLLIVQTQIKISFAKKYKTMIDARMDFLTLFPLDESTKKLIEKIIDIEPIWSEPYLPDQDWLDQKYKKLAKYYLQNIKTKITSKKRTADSSTIKQPSDSTSSSTPCNQAAVDFSKALHAPMQPSSHAFLKSSSCNHAPMQPCMNKNSSKVLKPNKRGPHATNP